ncbi:MAG: DUF1800 domain-containing protein [Cytophagaceae bacterium]|nr:DUF1800 domain-containing protein [Cytophagaceae bacterium]MDW8455698.1 DUF1800 family protein [Cytophagaceae bacterium]
MPLPQHTGILGHKAAAHLLRRATFGATKSDVDTYAGLTVTQALNNLFTHTAEPLPPVAPGASVSWLTQPPATNEDDTMQQAWFKYWWLGIILGSRVPAHERLAFSTREKVTFFLHTFFTTIQEVVQSSRALYFQNVLFRKFAFDGTAGPLVSIKELTKKICIDNAMLQLLDGRLNVKGNPNENFARELFELYTIGKGLQGQIPNTGTPGDYFYFTEQDVKSAAKVLSGYDFDRTFSTLDPQTNLPRGKIKTGAGNLPNQHDNSIKTFSHRFGNAVVQPNPALMLGSQPTEASMLDEIDQLINIIFAQPETALHICRRIYRFYVYHDITPSIDTNIIQQMANSLTANNFKIEPVIRELLGSQHFFDSANASVDDDNFGAIIKSPLDLITGSLSFFEYNLPDYLSDTNLFYAKTSALCERMEEQGLRFLNPYDVAGYDAYHQFPLFNRHWISSNALTQRYKFIHEIMTIDNTMPEAINIDLLQFIQQRFNNNALNPDLLIRELVSYLFPMYNEGTEITTARLEYFKNQFFKLGMGLPQGPLNFWQFSYSNASSSMTSATDARGMLQDLINAMLQSPEYQLM